MRHAEYTMVAGIGVAAIVLGLVGLLVGATGFGTAVLAVGALITLSGVVGAMWNC